MSVEAGAPLTRPGANLRAASITADWATAFGLTVGGAEAAFLATSPANCTKLFAASYS